MATGFDARAAAQVTIPDEYGKVIKTAEAVGALGVDLFGEETNFYTGATTSATDVSLPGNDALPVAVGRRFIVESRGANDRDLLLTRDGGFADWELDIPHMHGVYSSRKGPTRTFRATSSASPRTSPDAPRTGRPQ